VVVVVVVVVLAVVPSVSVWGSVGGVLIRLYQAIYVVTRHEARDCVQ
jgi:hypothetical protein